MVNGQSERNLLKWIFAYHLYKQLTNQVLRVNGKQPRVNPLIPRSDENSISRYNTNTLSSRTVARIHKIINLKILSSCTTTFTKLKLKELYDYE